MMVGLPWNGGWTSLEWWLDFLGMVVGLPWNGGWTSLEWWLDFLGILRSIFPLGSVWPNGGSNRFNGVGLLAELWFASLEPSPDVKVTSGTKDGIPYPNFQFPVVIFLLGLAVKNWLIRYDLKMFPQVFWVTHEQKQGEPVISCNYIDITNT